MNRIGIAVASFTFVAGLALGAMAAGETVTGTVDKVDVVKGVLTLKTPAGPREFNIRPPEKLKDILPGDKVSLTIDENGTVVIHERLAKT